MDRTLLSRSGITMKRSSPLFFASLFLLATAACGGSIAPVDDGSGSGSGSGSATGPGSGSGSGSGSASGSGSGGAAPHPTPGPGAWSTTASGCSNFIVYASHSSGLKYLVIRASKTELGLASVGDSATVDLTPSAVSSSTEVAVDTYAHAPGFAPYCADVLVGPQTPSHATATAGTATFTIASVGRDTPDYAVTVTLKDVVVRSADGTLETIPDVTYQNVNVGWLPG